MMLLMTTCCAFVFLVAKFAVAGEHWAEAFVIFLALAISLMAFFSVMFAVAYVLSIAGTKRSAEVESPFATDRLPPQVIQPREVNDVL